MRNFSSKLSTGAAPAPAPASAAHEAEAAADDDEDDDEEEEAGESSNCHCHSQWFLLLLLLLLLIRTASHLDSYFYVISQNGKMDVRRVVAFIILIIIIIIQLQPIHFKRTIWFPSLLHERKRKIAIMFCHCCQFKTCICLIILCRL